jgi:serine/threonine-protein kinase
MTTPPNRAERVILDDSWEPPPRTFRFPPLAASAIVVLVLSVALVSMRSVWTGEKARLAQDWEAQQPATHEPVESPWSPIPSAALRADSTWLAARAAINAPARSPRVRSSPSPAEPALSVAKGGGDQEVTTIPGYLSINSTPWSELSVDGRVIGNTPQLNIRVPPGRHELVLTRKGFETRRTSVTVGSGRTVRVTNITLKRNAQ